MFEIFFFLRQQRKKIKLKIPRERFHLFSMNRENYIILENSL